MLVAVEVLILFNIMKKNYILFAFIFGALFMHQVQAQKVSPIGYYPMLNWDTSPYKSFRYTRPNSTSDWLNFRLLYPENYDSLAENGPALKIEASI